MNRISVIVADQHSLVRAGVQAVLERVRGIRVAGSCDNGREAVRLVKRLKPAVMLTDIPMPLLNGLEAARQVSEQFPFTRVIMLTALRDVYEIEQAVRARVSGYILKTMPENVLPEAVMTVADGREFFSPDISIHIKRNRDIPGFATRQPDGLSGREVEVLQLAVEDKSMKQIAAALGISIKTVDGYRQSLMKKTNCHSIAGLTQLAIRRKIIEGN